jgi:hypothetical protein
MPRGSSVTVAAITASTVGPVKGIWPVSIS